MFMLPSMAQEEIDVSSGDAHAGNDVGEILSFKLKTDISCAELILQNDESYKKLVRV